MNADAPADDGANLRQFIAELATLGAGMRNPTALPEVGTSDLRAVPADADLISRFSEAAQAAGCTVHRAIENTWISVIVELLRSATAGRVLVESQPGSALTPERAAALIAALSADGMTAFQTYDDETLFTADAAVTAVRLAVAETGTLVCVSGPGSARAASLAQIVPDLFDVFSRLGAANEGPTASSCVSLITGPSKTADIEGVLITGVHGPGHVHIVILPN